MCMNISIAPKGIGNLSAWPRLPASPATLRAALIDLETPLDQAVDLRESSPWDRWRPAGLFLLPFTPL
jgi:hypothetical protein